MASRSRFGSACTPDSSSLERWGAGETREELAIVGDTPHIAARVESIAPPGSVAITDATHDVVEGHFETEPLGVKSLKGVSRRVSVHRMVSGSGSVDGLETVRPSRLAPMVGRDRQLAQLQGAWQEAKSGTGAIALVSGEGRPSTRRQRLPSSFEI